MTSLREQVCSYIEKTYGVAEERLWKRYPNYLVFRHKDNQKWFALIMDVDGNKLGLEGHEMLAIMEDQDRWVRKKSAEYYNRKYNELLYYGLGTDESEE